MTPDQMKPPAGFLREIAEEFSKNSYVGAGVPEMMEYRTVLLKRHEKKKKHREHRKMVAAKHREAKKLELGDKYVVAKKPPRKSVLEDPVFYSDLYKSVPEDIRNSFPDDVHKVVLAMGKNPSYTVKQKEKTLKCLVQAINELKSAKDLSEYELHRPEPVEVIMLQDKNKTYKAKVLPP
eukprot:TRINITY_DN7482_c2_g1_i2.p1 TRINITY_DN7482_c2_g1~~TRINITY_DN7482_c2_g1_i2.p1  ORF type:complete len:199 (+),score=34.11 TRINITY_DN7482_c2_g1_i2:63-599(+)